MGEVTLANSKPSAVAAPAAPLADRAFTRSTMILIVACVLCAILDGYDVVVISYVVPLLSKEWSEPLAGFGIVFSIGLVGLVVGALGLAPLADQHGRRKIMLGALVLGAVATFANAFVGGLVPLLVCRLFVGLAMGVIIALVVTIAHEASPPRYRMLIVTIVGCGLSLGNLAAGLLASVVLPRFGWEPLFLGAAALNVLIGAMFVVTLRDSVVARKTARTHYLSHIGSLFSKDLAKLTVVLWVLHFGGVGANYMLISWLPSLLTRSGYAAADAALATSLISFGGLVGGLLSGFALARFGRAWIFTLYGCAALLIVTIPFVLGTPWLYAINFVVGICIVGGYISNNAITSELYPASSRASGLGWAQGVGRSGGVITPLIVSLALQLNASLTQIVLLAAVFPLMSTIAAILLGKVSAPTELRTDEVT
ncbi:MAG: MFS transporter [Candidatus Andeanibacterium colombiense]|uniref:MFS transporter n=1 Tax=Candidatus Andeanibacterium colombiense TaxID=3121345 RepID=A0AAJ5X5E7_9SPHN|nr:MAG: MFS transporter [Sphingomonadaceae bacterium]